MNIRTLFAKRRYDRRSRPLTTDWTVGWTQRDLADLPTYHPRRNDIR